MFLFSLISWLPAAAAESFTMIITGNLKGNFTTEAMGQELNDPLILLGQNISQEMRKKNTFYFDMGNAFYPGILSKFSYGSSVMDYFSSFHCSGTLLSSHDLQVGLSNLRFLSEKAETRFLSSNLKVSGKKFIYPYIIKRAGNRKIAFIGISSRGVEVDETEKAIEKIEKISDVRAVSVSIAEAKNEGADYIILFSGLSFRQTLRLVRKFKDIDLVVTGGDNNGKLLGNEGREIRLGDGRQIIILPETTGYLKVNVAPGKAPGNIRSQLLIPRHQKVKSREYDEFIQRITGWKNLLKKEMSTLLYDSGKTKIEINIERVADLLRINFNSEVCYIDKQAIFNRSLQGTITNLKLYSMINSEFSIVTFKLKGSELKKIGSDNDNFIVRGFKKGKVQGYSVDDRRDYKIVATQTVLKKIQGILKKRIRYKNSWKNIYQTVSDDFKKERFLATSREGAADDTFRFFSDIYVSLIFENSKVKKGSDIETPPGKALEAYTRWGVESYFDFVFYNRLHYIKLTPKIHYVREDDVYINNLLRGTFYYKLNIPYFVNPYHKSQIDSVVAAVEGLRPTIIRETVGATIVTSHLAGNTGIGFEKQVADPSGSFVYGLEAILNFQITFFKYINYAVSLDAFLSLGDVSSNKRYLKSDLQNSLTFNFNSKLSVTFKHVLFYYYSMNIRQHYINSQITTSLNFNTDFKFW